MRIPSMITLGWAGHAKLASYQYSCMLKGDYHDHGRMQRLEAADGSTASEHKHPDRHGSQRLHVAWLPQPACGEGWRFYAASSHGYPAATPGRRKRAGSGSDPEVCGSSGAMGYMNHGQNYSWGAYVGVIQDPS